MIKATAIFLTLLTTVAGLVLPIGSLWNPVLTAAHQNSGNPELLNKTFTVDSMSDLVDTNPGDGICSAAGGQCTLRAAVMEANSSIGPDTIIIPSGIYMLTIAGTAEDMAALGDLDITESVTIQGAGQENTIIDGNALDTVFHVNGTDIVVVFEGISIQNGNGFFYQAGGIHLSSGTLEVISSTITNNASSLGAGIDNRGTLTLANSTVSNNTAEDGAGGIFNGGALILNDSAVISNTSQGSGGGGGISNSGDLTLTNSVVNNNTATFSFGWGGGIYNTGSKVILIDSTVSNNVVSGGGGGIASEGTGLQLIGSSILSNTAEYGGGINSYGAVIVNSLIGGNEAFGGGGGINIFTGTLTNTTISGNSTYGNGGGILSSGTINMNSVTLTGNTADSNADGSGDGGGIFVQTGTSSNVKNTILAGNSDLSPSTQHPDCSGTLISFGYNLIQNTSGCGIGGDSVGNLLNVDPNLGSLQDNGGSTLTHALEIGSIAIDNGICFSISGTVITNDQRDFGRPMDGDDDGLAACDIGAYERGSSITTHPSLDTTLVYTDTQGNPTIIEVPAGAVAYTTTLQFSFTSISLPPAGLTFANHAFELDAYQNGSIVSGFTFQKPVTVTIHYSDADLSGTDESGLSLMYWSGNTWLESAATCSPTSAYVHNMENNLISIPICHLSRYALFGPEVIFKVYLPLAAR